MTSTKDLLRALPRIALGRVLKDEAYEKMRFLPLGEPYFVEIQDGPSSVVIPTEFSKENILFRDDGTITGPVIPGGRLSGHVAIVLEKAVQYSTTTEVLAALLLGKKITIDDYLEAGKPYLSIISV